MTVLIGSCLCQDKRVWHSPIIGEPCRDLVHHGAPLRVLGNAAPSRSLHP